MHEFYILTETLIIVFLDDFFGIILCHFRSYTALLGVHNVNSNSEIQRISAEQPFPHKNFNQTSLKNDVMLLKVRVSLHRKYNIMKILSPTLLFLNAPLNSSLKKKVQFTFLILFYLFVFSSS